MPYTAFLLIALPFLETGANAPHLPALPSPAGATPALLACAMVTLAALAAAWIGLRRSASTDQRARALQLQLGCEREARTQADQALAANQDVLCRLVSQHEGVREGERTRIARHLQTGLGRRLLVLRTDLARLHDNAATPGLASRLDRALANIDGAISAVRAVTGGPRRFGPGDGLRHALERCLAEHAQSYGVRYCFEAGIDPATRDGHDRAARVLVLRVLQELLAAGSHTGAAGEIAVRLGEGAAALGLTIDGCVAPHDGGLSATLLDQLGALGGAIHRTGARQDCWRLTIPLRNLVDAA